MAGASMLLSPDSAFAEEATQTPAPTPDTSSQGTSQTTETTTATTVVTPQLTQINTVLAVIPTPSATVTNTVTNAVVQTTEAVVAAQTATQTQTALDSAQTTLASASSTAASATASATAIQQQATTIQSQVANQTAVVAGASVIASNAQAEANAANSSTTVTETFNNNTTNVTTVTTPPGVSISGPWNTPQTSGPALVLMGPAADVVIDVNPSNTGTVTQVSLGVYAKNGDTTMTATNADGTTSTEIINNNVSQETQAVSYTSVETITGTNIQTVTIAADYDYYVIDNIRITKTSSDPALVQAALTAQQALATAQQALATLQASSSTTAEALAAAQASATLAQTNLTAAATAASLANTADVAADTAVVVESAQAITAVANAQVAVSQAAVTTLQSTVTATQATADTLNVDASAQAAITNAQTKVTEASVAVAVALDKKTQAETLQAAAGATTTVESATAVVEDKTAVVLVAEDAVDAQAVVVADAQTAKNTAQIVVDASRQPGLKVSTYAYNGGPSPALPAASATPLSTYVDTNGINEQWSSGEVARSGRAERVIVKYEGDITFNTTGTSWFTASADDGTYVYLNNTLVANDWIDKGGGGSTIEYTTSAGQKVPFTLWYYENGGGAAVSFMQYTNSGWQTVTSFSVSSASPSQQAALASAVTVLNTETTELTTLQAVEAQANQHLASAQATLILATSAETARTEFVELAQTAIDKTVEAVTAVSQATDAVAVYVPATYTANDAASLVTAINNANATPANDTIVIAQGLVSLDANLPTITKNVTIDGAGLNSTFVDANGHNVFTVSNSATVTISDMTIQEAAVAVSNSSGNITINDTTITSGNVGIRQNGSGVTTINDSTIIANQTGITSDYGSTTSNVQTDDTAYTNRIYVNNTSFVYNSEAISTERFVAVDDSTFYANNTAASLRGLNKVSVTDSDFISNGTSIETFSWQPTSWTVDSGNRVFTGNTFSNIGNVAISLNDYLNNGTQSNATAVVSNNTFNLDRTDIAISSPTNDYTAINNTMTPTYVDAPIAVTVTPLSDGSVNVSWQAPTEGLAPERYAVFFTTGETAGWAVATGNVGDENALNTSIILPANIFESTGGLGETYTFSVRADNDTLAVYSSAVVTEPVVVIDPVAEAARVQAAAIAAELARAIAEAAAQAAAASVYVPPVPMPLPPAPAPEAPAPVEPPPTLPLPGEEVTPPSPEDPAPLPQDPELPIVPDAPKDPAPQPPTEPEPPVLPEEPPAPKPEPVEPPPPLEPPAPEPKPDPTPSAKETTTEALSDGKVSASEAKDVGESLAADGKVSIAEVKDVVAQISNGGELTASEKGAVAAVLVAAFTDNGNAVPAAVIAAAGIEYKDLPPDTPVETRTDSSGQPIVIAAEVAADIALVTDPGALAEALLTDPGAAIAALGSLGADMSVEERAESEKAIVAGVIAAGVAVQAAAGAAVAAATTSAPSAPSSSTPRTGGDGGAPVARENGTTRRKPTTKTKKPAQKSGRIRRIRLRRPK
jgi:hypothetical protein